MSVGGLLPQTCSITTQTWARDPVTFERVPTESTTTGIRCNAQVVSAHELGRPALAGETVYNVYLPYGTAVKVADAITAITGLTNITLSVQSDPLDDSGRRAYTRVRAVHVTGGAVL